jgi:hypothetical protein
MSIRALQLQWSENVKVFSAEVNQKTAVMMQTGLFQQT